MDKEKEIEEMAKVLYGHYCGKDECGKCKMPNCGEYRRAEYLYNAGYRKMDEITLKLDLGDRTPEEIKQIAERFSKALNEAQPVISLSDNEIRRQAVMEFADKLKENLLEVYTKEYGRVSVVGEDAIDDILKEKYGK